jgi:PAS domain S-box-containing protein
MRLRDLSFGLKLKLLVLLAAAVPLLMAAWVVLKGERDALTGAEAAELSGAARLVAGNTTAAVAFGDADAAAENLASLSAMPEIVLAAAYDGEGRLFAAYRRTPADTRLPARAPRPGRWLEEGDLLLAHELTLKGEHVGTVLLRSDTRDVSQRLGEHASSILAVLLAAGAAVLLLSVRAQGALTRPLLRLGEAARRVSQERDYSLRVPVAAYDEIGALTAAFNDMLSQIQQRDYALMAARDELEGRVRQRVAELQREMRERRGVESALRDSQSKLNDILEHTTNLFYARGTDDVLTFVSPQARGFLDCEPEELRRRWKELIVDSPVNVSAQETAQRALATGQRQPSYELELRTPKGRTVWAEVNEAPVVKDGRVVGLVGALTDITARKEAEGERASLEEQVRQSQKMEAVGRLAGGVAHDFNNLLNVILGYAELLRRSLPRGQREERRLDEIVKAADRAAGLTRQLLAFSRKQVLDARVLDLCAVVTDMEGMLSRLIREDVHLQVRCQPGLSPIKADRSQIEQVVMNLAVNARDAMPQGGALSIEVANVPPSEGAGLAALGLEAGLYVRLTVSDTGHGMDPGTLSHVFEPFFTTKPKGQGTGLGLATVYGVVKQSGGAVNVQSSPGQGSTFSVYLPAVEPTGEPARLPAPAPAAGQGTLLLVEDEDALRQLTRELLEDHGFTVLDAANGQAALGLLAGHGGAVDLLLTDVIMPGMSGRELAQRVASQRPGTRVLYMSGYTADVIAPHGVLEDGVLLLHKPFSVEMLLRRVQEAMRAPWKRNPETA